MRVLFCSFPPRLLLLLVLVSPYPGCLEEPLGEVLTSGLRVRLGRLEHTSLAVRSLPSSSLPAAACGCVASSLWPSSQAPGPAVRRALQEAAFPLGAHRGIGQRDTHNLETCVSGGRVVAITSGSSRCIKAVIFGVDCFPLRCAQHNCSTLLGIIIFLQVAAAQGLPPGVLAEQT